MSALDDIVRDGKVRFVGLSNFKLDEIEACMKVRRVDVVQYGWNMFDRRMQTRDPPVLRTSNGVGFMAYGSLAYGLLTGTFTEDQDFGSADWRARQGKMGSIKLFEALFGAGDVPAQRPGGQRAEGRSPRRYDRSLPQLALRWAISHPAVSTSLVGCRNVAEVEDNAGAIGWSISDDDLAEIDAIFARHGVDTVPDYLDRGSTDGSGGTAMSRELAGKVAIVTGGAGGIGRGIVEVLRRGRRRGRDRRRRRRARRRPRLGARRRRLRSSRPTSPMRIRCRRSSTSPSSASAGCT